MSVPENAGSPEFAAAQTARWAKEDRFSMRYGVAALRRVRTQRIHVLVFALALGAVLAAIVLIPSGSEMGWALAGLIGWTAVCGAVGRASLMKVVSRRNAAPGHARNPAARASSDRLALRTPPFPAPTTS